MTRLGEDAPWDLHMTVPAFTQAIHGFENFGRDVAEYMEGVELRGDCRDFFRAFPNRPCGSFELY